MQEQIKQKIVGATSIALATTGPNGLNVVPLSAWEVVGEKIHVYDFFMHKTAENLQVEKQVALACWRDFVGVQVKGTASYETSGEVYENTVKEMKERFPDRTLKAVIRITPVAIYDITPGGSVENMLG